jgi:5'-nucleotidase
MNNDRRTFINQLSFVTALAALSKPMGSLAIASKKINTISSSGREVAVYHTNDLHGNIQPVFGGTGGLDQIQTLLKKQETNGLLLDAGGFLNMAKSSSSQKMMIQTMNKMGYHAAAIGDDELALGQDHLASLARHMQFSLVNCNYGFDGELKKRVKPYIIIKTGKFKTGVTGVGHKVDGVKYNDAIQSAIAAASHLKQMEKCDLVICLSHLGYEQTGDQPDDQKLAKQSEHIDMIISGHNCKLSMDPVVLRNRLKHEVIIGGGAFNGLMLGKAIFNFENSGLKHNLTVKNLIAGQRFGENFVSSFAELKANEKLLATV